MAEQSWFNSGADSSQIPPSFFASDPLPPPPVPQRPSAYELRPLTTGEVLDRTFYLYRTNFWLFVAISAVAAAVTTFTSLGQTIYLHFSRVAPGPLAIFTPWRLGFTFVSSLLYLVVYSVSQAATVSAVTSIYLGERTSMAQSFRAVSSRWFRFSVIALWQAWSAIWLPLVLLVPLIFASAFLRGRAGASLGATAAIGIAILVALFGGAVYGVIAYIRNSLAVPAEVMEGLSIRAAMKRSKALAAGTKGRIFLLLLFLLALYIVAIAIESPLTFLIIRHKGVQVFLLQTMLVFVNFLVTSIIAPVGAIGLCLFYIDQRVRKEGFDIEFLIDRSAPPSADTASLPETP